MQANCARCGKGFSTKPSHLAKGWGKYCSLACWGAARANPANFWRRVDKSGECWLWTGEIGTGGYGRVRFRCRHRSTHRLAYELTHGPIPCGMFVLHNCPGGDNPRCVNPAHLWLGTAAQNSADMVAKGRQAKGERQAHHRLTEEDVREIRALFAAGNGGPAVLGKRFGVSDTMIINILRGKAWKHVV
jgi:hypothetical protein